MKPENYNDCIEFLCELPVFSMQGAAAYKPGLDNIKKLCEANKNPQNSFKSIHIAGTNGKGSTSHFLASILQENGYKTGLFTSPHLIDFTERIKINGIECNHEFIIEFIHNNYIIINELKPSFFEVTTCMAFCYFAQQKVDIAVIETGMGGRLDSTNIITPILSIITQIGMDHMAYLGNTLPKIAFEKAGIIKARIPVVISEFQEEVQQVFEQKASETQSKMYDTEYIEIEAQLTAFSTNYRVKSTKNVAYNFNTQSQLGGKYQEKNLKGVLKSIELLNQMGYKTEIEKVKRGINKVITNTGLYGRWQTLNIKPLIICESAHNESGINYLLHSVSSITYSNLFIILGFSADKNVASILSLLPPNSNFIFTQAHSARALPYSELGTLAKKMGLEGIMVENVNLGIEKAKEMANQDDLILVTGSIYLLAEVNNIKQLLEV